eukprot:1845-Pelagomonas_calceolata.AAC.1
MNRQFLQPFFELIITERKTGHACHYAACIKERRSGFSLKETTEGTYLLKRFKQGKAMQLIISMIPFLDMCSHQADLAVTLLEALQCIYNSGC